MRSRVGDELDKYSYEPLSREKCGGGLFAVLSACVLPACKTDLSDVWNSIDNIDDRLSQVEKKIEEMNTNIDALGKICDALSSNVSVSSVTPLQDASGYEIVFSDGTKATIHNGTDAELPRLASGASLGEPYVQDATYISVDGGKTWTRISGENGVSFFESVKADESSSKVTLVLADGTVIEVPFVKDFMFAFAESEVKVAYGAEVEVPVTQKGVVTSQIVKPDGWNVTLKEDAVIVKAPSLANDFAETEGDVAVIAVSKGGFTKGSDKDEPTVFFRPIAGLVGTYSDGKIEFADNVAVGGPYTLQGYCWVAFDSDGNPVGRADAVIPVNISFEKYAQTASVAAKSSAEISGRTVADRTNARDSRSQMLFGFDIE